MNVENLVVVFIDVNTHCLCDLVLMSITTFTVNKQPVPSANSPHPIPTSTISTTVSQILDGTAWMIMLIQKLVK